MRSLTLLACLLMTSTSLFASVAKSWDDENKCDLYRVVRSNENGTPGTLNEGESIVINKEIFGLTFEKMEVKFDDREVLVSPIATIVLGLNRPLTANKVAIEESNPNFDYLVNQLNRKLFVFETLCLTKDSKVVYGEEFKDETKTNSKVKSKKSIKK